MLPAVRTAVVQGFPQMTGSICTVMVAAVGREIAAGMTTPRFRERLASQGAKLVGSTVAEAGAFIAAEDAL